MRFEPRHLLFAAYLVLVANLPVLATDLSSYHGAGDLPPVQDQVLREQLRTAVCEAGFCDLVAADRLSIALAVYEPGTPLSLAMLNGHNMVYAASLPKIAILLAAMVSAQRGELELNAALTEDLHQMIRSSCNACATRALTAVGRENLLSILQEPDFAFYDEDRAGGLWVGKDYAKSLAYRRDPIKNFSHAATPYQVARLYYRLDGGDLLEPKHTKMMKDMLAEPAIEHKFVAGLEAAGADIVMRKSGSWGIHHADSVLVRHGKQSYIAVALVADEDGEQILRTLIQLLDKLAKGRASP
jgi:beta-lactamase class A